MTSGDMLCVPNIRIEFVQRFGLGRAPTFHTCGPTIELPTNYRNFPDFRNEWENIMANKENLKMDIA